MSSMTCFIRLPGFVRADLGTFVYLSVRPWRRVVVGLLLLLRHRILFIRIMWDLHRPCQEACLRLGSLISPIGFGGSAVRLLMKPLALALPQAGLLRNQMTCTWYLELLSELVEPCSMLKFKENYPISWLMLVAMGHTHRSQRYLLCSLVAVNQMQYLQRWCFYQHRLYNLTLLLFFLFLRDFLDVRIFFSLVFGSNSLIHRCTHVMIAVSSKNF